MFSMVLCFCFLATCCFSSVEANEWIIVANAPFVSLEHLKKSLCGQKTMALDGAADHFKDDHAHLNVILGDFDSIKDKDHWGISGTFNNISEQENSYIGHFNVLIVPAKNQNYTDLEKGICYCDQHGATSIVILNATGGRLDHTLGNIGLLRKHYNHKRPIVIQTEAERIEYIKDGSTVVRGNVGDPCAIMGYPEATMSTTGLAYNGLDYPLQLGIQESTCNTLKEPEAHVAIQGEALIIHPLAKY